MSASEPSPGPVPGHLADPPPAPSHEHVQTGRVRLAITLALVVVVYAAVGAAGGWVWHRLWTPPQGAVIDHQWLPLDETATGLIFGATGLYLLVGVVGGLVLGLLTGALLRRSELFVLGAVVAGSVAAAWLSHLVGYHLGPPDPSVAASTAANYTKLPDDMSTPGHSVYAAWPLGSLLGLAVAYLVGRLPTPPQRLPRPPG